MNPNLAAPAAGRFSRRSSTLAASMDAASAAGSINLRSKNAFERSGRRIVDQAYAMGPF